MSWVQRVEDVLNMLKGSSIGEFELTEGEFELILRRASDSGNTTRALQPHGKPLMERAIAPDRSITAMAPLTGLYYSAPTPTSAPFVAVGDMVAVGQTIALIEAMKVFNEVQAEVAGRVMAIPAQNGSIVNKGDVLLQIEPIAIAG